MLIIVTDEPAVSYSGVSEHIIVRLFIFSLKIFAN